MRSPMRVRGETILDADANNILMGINRSMPSMFRLMARVRIAFHRRSRKRSRPCPSGIDESFGPVGPPKQRAFTFLTSIRRPCAKRWMGFAVPPTMQEWKHRSRGHAMIKVLIADDHAVFREGLGRILSDRARSLHQQEEGQHL